MVETRSERRLSAILAADIVGYSRMMEADEAGTLAVIRRLRTEVIDPLIAEHQGRVVKLMGDGAIVEFGSVVDAVRAAVEVQSAVGLAQPEADPAKRIVFRIGINLGDVVVDGDDLLGDGVNIAARLEQLCEPGGVLVSGTVYDHMQGKLDLPLDFAGEQKVKNISRPVRTYAVRVQGGKLPVIRRRGISRLLPLAVLGIVILLLAAGGTWLLIPRGATDAKPSIAVLPFDNLGGDEATGRLADGITEDVITDLARFRDLEVIARNSTMAYQGNAHDIRQIGRELNVRYVLEGSIQRQGEQLRVTAQLVDAASATHVWAERWDRPVEGIFAVQTELSEQVAGKIGGFTGTVLAADKDAAMRKRPSDLTAYDLYLLGIETKNRETMESVEEAIRLLKQSLEIDPRFARAWTMLGSAYAISTRWSDNPEERLKLYREAVARAVELDPLDAEAHAGLGFAVALSGDIKRGEAEFEEALRLNPNSADVLTRYSYWAAGFGKAERGAAMAERAVRLNPNAPPWAIRFLRYAFLAASQFESALGIHERLAREKYIDADYIDGAILLAEMGRADAAKALVAESLEKYPDLSIESWTGTSDWSEQERGTMNDMMRKAGFPACADAEEIKKEQIVVRLPECVPA